MSFARVRAIVVIGVLAVAAVVFVVVALVRDTQAGKTVSGGCPPGSVMANVNLPDETEVKLRVFNATDNDGWGTRVTDDFKNRRFQTQAPQDNKAIVADVAVLRYGPKAVGSAHLLRAYFLDQSETQYDAKRTSDIVDVIIGSKFRQLATTTEVNQSLVELGVPKVPPGACAVSEPNSAAK